MADVRINEVESRITVRDGDAALAPETLERIVRAVLDRLDETREAEARRAADRSLAGPRERLP